MNIGLVAIAAAIAIAFGNLASIGEAIVISHAIDGMTRNPEMESKIKSTMFVGVALDESTAIYSLVIAILILFVTGAKAV